MSKIRLGIDSGGTFTDFVALVDGKIITHKVLSTPKAPDEAIVRGIREMGLQAQLASGDLHIIHGTTVATNAVLEGKGAKTVFITNRGFKDTLLIGRQTRPYLYRFEFPEEAPLVEEAYCLETGGRVASDGSIIEELSEQDISNLQQQIVNLQPESIAISLLFSFINDKYEKKLSHSLALDIPISLSSQVLPQYREYERGVATYLNARLQPMMASYLNRLASSLKPSTISIMQSSGGTLHIDQAAENSVHLLLSGPAGGLIGAQSQAFKYQDKDIMTFDMGGTSTDVALVSRHNIPLTYESKLNRLPIAVPMVDMHTIGAGGGSIAFIDEGGLLQVGPESAGSNPGPACYGHGGQQPTVTDANVVLGRLPSTLQLASGLELDVTAAEKAMQSLADILASSVETVARGIIEIANEHMARALRVISIEKGYDPEQCCLCSFGGAGGLHATALAELLNMTSVIIPMHTGVLSAYGLLMARPERVLTHSVNQLLSTMTEQDIVSRIDRLADNGYQMLKQEGFRLEQIRREASVDICYQGQSFPLNLPYTPGQFSVEAFHTLHQKRYGHRLDLPLQLVNIRITLYVSIYAEPPAVSFSESMASPQQFSRLLGGSETKDDNLVPIYYRHQLALQQKIVGPAIVAETTATVFVDQGWELQLDLNGNINLTKIGF